MLSTVPAFRIAIWPSSSSLKSSRGPPASRPEAWQSSRNHTGPSKASSLDISNLLEPYLRTESRKTSDTSRPLRTRHRDSSFPHHVVYRETLLSISYVLASAVEPSRSRNLPWHWSQVSDFEDVCCRSTVCRDAVEAAYGVNFNGDEEKIVAHLFKLYAEKTAQA